MSSYDDRKADRISAIAASILLGKYKISAEMREKIVADHMAHVNGDAVKRSHDFGRDGITHQYVLERTQHLAGQAAHLHFSDFAPK